MRGEIVVGGNEKGKGIVIGEEWNSGMKRGGGGKDRSRRK